MFHARARPREESSAERAASQPRPPHPTRRRLTSHGGGGTLPTDVLLELQLRAAARGPPSESGHRPPTDVEDVAQGAVASPEHPSDCSESAGHPNPHSWQAVLGARAPLQRPSGSLDHFPLPDHLHPQHLDHLRLARVPRASPDAFGSTRRRVDASDVASGVAATLRRSHTVPISSLDAVSERTLGEAQAAAAAAARRRGARKRAQTAAPEPRRSTPRLRRRAGRTAR